MHVHAYKTSDKATTKYALKAEANCSKRNPSVDNDIVSTRNSSQNTEYGKIKYHETGVTLPILNTFGDIST